MGIRDNEIQRLEQYAKGLGIKVVWRTWQKGDPGASWATDGSEITLYTYPSQSKTQIILNFIHELAHHLSWVYNGRKGNLKTDRILDKDDNRQKRKDPPLPKSERKLIYEGERKDSEYQDLIFKELNLKISKQKFYINKKLDNWVYYRYYQSGEDPTQKEINLKKRKLINEYKKKKN